MKKWQDAKRLEENKEIDNKTLIKFLFPSLDCEFCKCSFLTDVNNSKEIGFINQKSIVLAKIRR